MADNSNDASQRLLLVALLFLHFLHDEQEFAGFAATATNAGLGPAMGIFLEERGTSQRGKGRNVPLVLERDRTVPLSTGSHIAVRNNQAKAHLYFFSDKLVAYKLAAEARRDVTSTTATRRQVTHVALAGQT